MAFEESLQQLGYLRGVNVAFETRASGSRAEDLPKAVAGWTPSNPRSKKAEAGQCGRLQGSG